jgi:hypothetical protein
MYRFFLVEEMLGSEDCIGKIDTLLDRWLVQTNSKDSEECIVDASDFAAQSVFERHS